MTAELPDRVRDTLTDFAQQYMTHRHIYGDRLSWHACEGCSEMAGYAVESAAASAAAERDRLHTLNAQLVEALEAITEEWYGLWVGSHAKFSTGEIRHAQIVEARARAALAATREEAAGA